jgi:hypothetical protein
MRTTLNLPDDVSVIIRAVADAKGLSLGDAAAELIRRGLHTDARVQQDEGVPCFAVPPDAPPITLEHTLAIEDEL